MNENQIYRQKARQDLGGSIFHNDWLMAMLVCLVAGAILSAAASLSNVFDSSKQKGAITVTVSLLSVATVFLMGPITFGLKRLFLNKARSGRPIVFGELFLGFRSYWEHFLLGFMPALFAALWFLIPIVGAFIGVYKAYGWAMVYYVKVDHPSLGWRECMDRSRQMMEGRRWKLFTLQLSFIGWYILGALALGVGTAWVDAYRNAAEVHFYEANRLWSVGR